MAARCSMKRWHKSGSNQTNCIFTPETHNEVTRDNTTYKMGKSQQSALGRAAFEVGNYFNYTS